MSGPGPTYREADLAAAMQARRAEMAAQYGVCAENWFIFGKIEDPATPQNPNVVYGKLTRFQKKHGLRRTSVHLLRHSFASLALQNGAALKDVQALLGHSRPSTTLQFYAGINERKQREAVDAVARVVVEDNKKTAKNRENST